MIYVIKHIDIEGPGILGDILEEAGFTLKTIELAKGEALPELSDSLEAVIVLGGPMNVYEEDKYPYLAEEDQFIREVIDKSVPFLGICLGAQLLAKACGSRIKKAKEEEIGFYQVDLTPEGEKDALFKGLDKEIDVFQWHGDTFDLPPKGTLIATAQVCRNQAFRIGKNAYGLQFHLEVTDQIIKSWIDEYFEAGDSDLQQKGSRIMDDYANLKAAFTSSGREICYNFTDIVKCSKKL